MTPKFFLINKTGTIVLGFFNEKRAQDAFSKIAGTFLVSRQEGLETVPAPALIAIYNAANSDKPVKKFTDKATAAKRVWPLLVEAAQVPDAEREAAEKATPVKAAAKTAPVKAAAKGAAKTAPVKAAATTGKAPQFAGKKLKRTKDGMEAKRREDTRRTESWNVLTDGMTFEDAVKAGARAADLDKMYRLGHITWK